MLYMFLGMLWVLGGMYHATRPFGKGYLTCYVPLGTHNMGGYMGAKYDKVKKNGAKGRPREENAALFLF
jgi:hypothetical protein